MPSYSAAEKENALHLCDQIGIAKASEETGISVKSLYTWRSIVERRRAASTAEADEISAEATTAEENEAIPNLESKSSGRRYTTEEKEKALRLCGDIGITKASTRTWIAIGSLRKWREDTQNGNPTAPAVVSEFRMEETDTEQNHSHTNSY